MTRPLLMIPGPVEVDGEVLAAMARPPMGHTGAGFIETFGKCLDDLRDVFAAPDAWRARLLAIESRGQSFVVAGGLHPAVATRSFRVGHMGVDGIGQVLTTLAAIEQGLGVTLRAGAGVAAAQARWLQP